MHRRRFVQTAAIAGAISPLLAGSATAGQATPMATPEPDGTRSLADLVARIDPGTLLDALLATPVTTPLFPVDTPPVEPVAWDDTGDTDLANAVGGVVFNTGFDENDNYLAVGNAIVHPDASSAIRAFTETGPVDAGVFLGLPWFVQAVSDYAVSVVRIDYLLLIGGADAVEPVGAGAMVLRAIAHMTALLDHLDAVLAALDA